MIITILAGALIGWIASMIMKTNASMGAIANIICGILGSFVGGFIPQIHGMGKFASLPTAPQKPEAKFKMERRKGVSPQ